MTSFWFDFMDRRGHCRPTECPAFLTVMVLKLPVLLLCLAVKQPTAMWFKAELMCRTFVCLWDTETRGRTCVWAAGCFQHMQHVVTATCFWPVKVSSFTARVCVCVLAGRSVIGWKTGFQKISHTEGLELFLSLYSNWKNCSSTGQRPSVD